MANREDEVLRTFRQQLYDEELLHDEDSIGADDDTLLYVRYVHLLIGAKQCIGDFLERASSMSS